MQSKVYCKRDRRGLTDLLEMAGHDKLQRSRLAHRRQTTHDTHSDRFRRWFRILHRSHSNSQTVHARKTLPYTP